MISPCKVISKRSDFLRAASSGRKNACGTMVMQVYSRADSEPLRAGYTVTKKVGNAVVRNRTKRVLRETVRLCLSGLDIPGYDIVLIGRSATGTASSERLREDFNRMLAAFGLTPEPSVQVSPVFP